MLWPSSGIGGIASRLARAACIALLVSLALAGVTAAHSSLTISEPADGAELTGTPGELRLAFDGFVDPALAEISIVDQDGRPIAIGAPRVDRGIELVVSLPPLERGIYRVRWKTISTADLHEVSGTIVFGIGRSPAAAVTPQVIRPPSFWSSAFRGLEILGFGLLVGAFALTRVMREPLPAPRPSSLPKSAQRRLRGLVVAGAALTVAAGAARLASALVGLPAGPGLLAAVAPQVILWFAGGVVLALLALVALRAWRPPQRGGAGPQRLSTSLDRRSDGLTVGLIIVAALTLAAPTHLGGLGELGTALGAVHILGAAVWIGGLAALAVVVPSIRAARGNVAKVVRRFALVAIPAAVALGISGILAGGTLVTSADVLAGQYGAALAVKLIVAAALAGIGLRNAASTHAFARGILNRATRVVGAVVGIRVRPPHVRIMPAWIRLELAVGATVVLAAAVLGATSPAPPAKRIPSVGAATGQAADLVVGVEVRPLRTGPNFLSLTVLDTRRPQPAPIEAVDVRLASGNGQYVTSSSAARLDSQHWEVPAALGLTGDWTATVVVHRHGLPDAQTSLGWLVPEPPPTTVARPFLVPSAITAGMLGAIILAVVIGLRRRQLPKPGARSIPDGMPARGPAAIGQ
jgi:copper transport protein